MGCSLCRRTRTRNWHCRARSRCRCRTARNSTLLSSALDIQLSFPANSDFDWPEAVGVGSRSSGMDFDFNMEPVRDNKTIASVATKAE